MKTPGPVPGVFHFRSGSAWESPGCACPGCACPGCACPGRGLPWKGHGEASPGHRQRRGRRSVPASSCGLPDRAVSRDIAGCVVCGVGHLRTLASANSGICELWHLRTLASKNRHRGSPRAELAADKDLCRQIRGASCGSCPLARFWVRAVRGTQARPTCGRLCSWSRPASTDMPILRALASGTISNPARTPPPQGSSHSIRSG